MTARQTPEEVHHFFGWSIEPIGDRHFVILADAGEGSARLSRYEISAGDLKRAKAGKLSLKEIGRKYDVVTYAFLAGIAEPSPAAKALLLGTAVLLIEVAVAWRMGWL